MTNFALFVLDNDFHSFTTRSSNGLISQFSHHYGGSSNKRCSQLRIKLCTRFHLCPLPTNGNEQIMNNPLFVFPTPFMGVNEEIGFHLLCLFLNRRQIHSQKRWIPVSSQHKRFSTSSNSCISFSISSYYLESLQLIMSPWLCGLQPDWFFYFDRNNPLP